MNYATALLIDIVESIEGIKHLGTEEKYGLLVKKYRGLMGNLVLIDVTDEEMDDETAKGHLTSLGLANLIPPLFPEQPPINDEDEIHQKGE